MPRVLSVHFGRIEPLGNRPGQFSAIYKRPVNGLVHLGHLGIEGDMQAEKPCHGGPSKAVCGYASEYYPEWRQLVGRDMPLGSFGENFALEGILDDEVCLGDVYNVGATRLRVTCPRGPCGTLSSHWGRPDFHLHVKRSRHCGYYMEVVEEGMVEGGMEFRLGERPHPDWTMRHVWELFDEKEPDRGRLEQLLTFDFLDHDWVKRAEKRLGVPTP